MQATLRDATGASIGRVVFTASSGNTTLIAVSARLPAGVGVDGIRGFHVHANDNPANGRRLHCRSGAARDDAFRFGRRPLQSGWRHARRSRRRHAGTVFYRERQRRDELHPRSLHPAAIRGRAVILHIAPRQLRKRPGGRCCEPVHAEQPRSHDTHAEHRQCRCPHRLRRDSVAFSGFHRGPSMMTPSRASASCWSPDDPTSRWVGNAFEP